MEVNSSCNSIYSNNYKSKHSTYLSASKFTLVFLVTIKYLPVSYSRGI